MDKVSNKILSKPFLNSLFFIQNKWHQHGVLVHTIRVLYCTIKAKQYKMIATAIFHDIGKPFSAYKKDEEDIVFGEYSFTDHEERSYQIIKNWPFLSSYTKNMVRYHYLIRDIKKSKTEDFKRYENKIKIWNSLDEKMKKDLEIFIKLDDEGKGKKRRD